MIEKKRRVCERGGGGTRRSLVKGGAERTRSQTQPDLLANNDLFSFTIVIRKSLESVVKYCSLSDSYSQIY